MISKPKLRAIVSAVALTMALTAAPAYAITPVIDAAVVAALAAATTTVTGAITTATLVIQNALGAVAGRISAEIERGHVLSANVADANNRIMVDVQRQLLQYQAARTLAPAPNGCKTGQIVKYAQRAEGDRGLVNAILARSSLSELQQYNTPTQTTSNLLQRMQQYGPGGASKDLPNADIQMGSVIDGASANAAASKKTVLTGVAPYTYSQADLSASYAYLQNVVSGTVPPTTPKSIEGTEKGKEYTAKRHQILAQSSAITQVMGDIISRRSPVANLGDMAATVFNDNTLSGKKISWMSMIKMDVDRRYSNPDWFLKTNTLPPEAILKEIVYMQALALNMQFAQIRQGENLEILGAMQLAKKLEADRPALDTMLYQAQVKGR
jgi:hypothetical protein